MLEKPKAASNEAAFFFFVTTSRPNNELSERVAVSGRPDARNGRDRWRMGAVSTSGLFADRTRFYVPISQDARYFFCSAVNVSMFTPMPASLSRAISLSMAGGTGYTFFSRCL